MRSITSRRNPLVQAFRDASAHTAPDGSRIVLDGVHLVREARAAGVALDVVAVAASRLADVCEEGQLARTLEREGTDVVSAPDEVFAAMSPVRSPSGLVALARRDGVTADAICAHPDAFVLAVEDVQDPGNVGALLRTAEAFGVTGVIVCGASAHPFSWKAVRGSMGSALRLPVAGPMEAVAALEVMTRARLRTSAAVARGGDAPEALDWHGRHALWVGGEGPGLSEAIVLGCERRVTIPLADSVESLNVAVAGAVLIYAARRQRT